MASLLAGSKGLYRRLLLLLANRECTFSARCRNLLAQREFTTAACMVRELRANCSSLGAIEVARLAELLEQAIGQTMRTADSTDLAAAPLEDLDNMLRPLVACIQTQSQPTG